MGLAYQTAYDVLYICFANAAQHANPIGDTKISAGLLSPADSTQSQFWLSVTSQHKPDTSDEAVTQAVETALANDKGGESMIREGNTGLAKARGMMAAYGPGGRFSWSAEDGELRVTVTLPIIIM